MSFFGFQSSPARPIRETHESELERLRGRQLASLVRAGGRAKNQTQTIFEVPVADTQRGPLSLVLTLSKDFPMKAPQVQTNMAVQHPWLDINGNVTGHQDLNRWSAHSDLGRIVSEIVSELKRLTAAALQQSRTPSYPFPQQTQPMQQTPVYTDPYQNYQPATPIQPSTPTPPLKNTQPEVHRTQMPEIPAIFPELEALSISQLETLNSDRHAIKALVKNTSIAKDFCKLRDEVLEGNLTIAQSTLKHKDEIQNLQREIQELRTKLRQSQESLAEKQSRQQRILALYHPDHLLEQLRGATRSLDTETEDIACRLTRGEIDLQSFLKEYIPQRSLYHERMTKLQRLLEH